ncbi:MAG: nucleotidyltransferase domain-containing protein [Betaproteobacteria bacterium]
MEEEKMLSAHPVSDAMRQRVLHHIARIEDVEDARVLFACESGSRGWGFASPDSDYDVRFIYVRRLDSYLTLEPVRDVIERPIDDELDIGGWYLRKALQLLRDSNPTLMEWLRSPIVYSQEDEFATRLMALAVSGFSPVRGYHHYVSMAKKNLREHLSGDVVRYKKYLYVLRPLLAARWIREGRGIPPMRFAELAQSTLDDTALIAEINALLAVKMRASESATSPRWLGLHAFIERELAQAQAHPMTQATKAEGAALDRLLSDTVRRLDAAAATTERTEGRIHDRN